MEQHVHGAITWFQFDIFKKLNGLVTHGIFTRHGGVSKPPFASLNAGPTVSDDPASLHENYRRIKAALPGHPRLVSAIPGQSTEVIEITSDLPGVHDTQPLILPRRLDGLITRMRGVGLFWAVADCTVMLAVDPVHQAIAAVHAGWRGTSQAIMVKAIDMMGNLYGTRPADLYIGLSPSIGPCCYEVDEKVRAAFQMHPIAAKHASFSTISIVGHDNVPHSSLRLDIAASNYAQLLATGIPSERIELSGVCTGCRRDLFFSNRMEGGNTGRFATVLALL
jgi:YfiH family protein